jgi:enoyl-CoA hydratase/carnithine racemase
MLRETRERGTAIWTIDRPDVKNALDHATMRAVIDAVARAAGDATIRAAIVTGAGDAFVSGGDLRELREKTTADDAEVLSDTGFDLCRAIAELPFPVIAALDGVAIGGGAELAAACDLRIADPSARISFKQVRLGVTTAWGTAARLVALVGAGAAAHLLYSACDLAAQEAKAIGLVDAIADDGGALALAIAWCDEIAKGSPAAVRDMKRLVRAASSPREDVRPLERELFVAGWSGPDHAEAVEAFFARRAPLWRSR